MNQPAKLTDRQQHPRHSTQCSGKLYADDREVDCEILNISVGGAKVVNDKVNPLKKER